MKDKDTAMTSTAIPSPKGEEENARLIAQVHGLQAIRQKAIDRGLPGNVLGCDLELAKLAPQLANALLSPSSSEDVRREALEEAAKVADEWAQERWMARAKTFATAGQEVARRIRALSQKE